MATARRTTWTGVLAFVAVTLGVSLLAVVARRPPLTLEEVLRNAGQLAALAAQTRVDAPASDAAVTVTYTYESPCGDVAGLAVLNQWTRENRPAPPETQLGFALQARAGRGRRGSGRQGGPTVRLIRDEAGSDLVAPAAPAVTADGGGRPGAAAPGVDGPSSRWRPAAVAVRLLPAGAAPAAGLAVNNLLGSGAAASGQTRHRGLAGLAAPVHCNLTARDLGVFALLARVLRVRICDDPDAAGSPCYDAALTLYRAAPGGRYWIEVRSLRGDLGMLAYLLQVTENRGQPWRGQIQVIRRRTDLARPADLFFARPGEPGVLLTPADPGFRVVPYRPLARRPRPPVEVDFPALVGETAVR